MKKRSLTGRFFLPLLKKFATASYFNFAQVLLPPKSGKIRIFFERSGNFFVDRFAGLRILYLRRIALTVKSREIIL